VWRCCTKRPLFATLRPGKYVSRTNSRHSIQRLPASCYVSHCSVLPYIPLSCSIVHSVQWGWREVSLPFSLLLLYISSEFCVAFQQTTQNFILEDRSFKISSIYCLLFPSIESQFTASEHMIHGQTLNFKTWCTENLLSVCRQFTDITF
jgi:hypothetical protein